MVEDVQVGMNVRQYADPAFLLDIESDDAKKRPPAVANAPLVRERADVAAGLIEDNLRSGAWGVVGRQADLVAAGAMPRTSAFTVEWTKPRGCIDCLAVNANTAPRRVQLEGASHAWPIVEVRAVVRALIHRIPFVVCVRAADWCMTGLDAVRDNVAVDDDTDAPWQATLDQTSGYANNLLDEASSLLFCV